MEWGESYTLNWGDENVHQWCYEESRVIFRGQLMWNTKQRCSLLRLLSRCGPFANWQNLSGSQDQINLNTPSVSISLGTTTAPPCFFHWFNSINSDPCLEKCLLQHKLSHTDHTHTQAFFSIAQNSLSTQPKIA